MKRFLIPAALAALAAVALFRPSARPPAAISSSVAPLPEHQLERVRQSSRPSIVVYVAGAVARPGLYRLHPGLRFDDAVRLAGGLRRGADAGGVNLAQIVDDGDEILVPRVGEARRRTSRSFSSHRRKRKHHAATPVLGQPVDLNAADAAALASLPGIGQTLATRIVAYRRINGPFASTDELLDVAGMTQRRVDALAALVYVSVH